MSDPVRDLAEELYEEIGGDLCICQREDVPHWCERCQCRLDTIVAAFNRVKAALPASAPPPMTSWCSEHGLVRHERCETCALAASVSAVAPAGERGEIMDLLVECSAFMDNYVDVNDGDYGEPRPNRAMSLKSRVDEAIDALEAALPVSAPQNEAERTVASIAAMLGWMNVPPRHVLEADISALKARARTAVPVSAPPQDEAAQLDESFAALMAYTEPVDDDVPVSAAVPPQQDSRTKPKI